MAAVKYPRDFFLGSVLYGGLFVLLTILGKVSFRKKVGPHLVAGSRSWFYSDRLSKKILHTSTSVLCYIHFSEGLLSCQNFWKLLDSSKSRKPFFSAHKVYWCSACFCFLWIKMSETGVYRLKVGNIYTSDMCQVHKCVSITFVVMLTSDVEVDVIWPLVGKFDETVATVGVDQVSRYGIPHLPPPRRFICVASGQLCSWGEQCCTF